MKTSPKITYRGLTPDVALDEQIRSSVARLDAVYDRIVRCEVLIEAPHRRHRQGRQFHVRVTLGLPGGKLVVSQDPGLNEAHEDALVAVRDAFQALRRQLEDHVQHQLRHEVKAHSLR